jgi:hypothetical protein
MTRLLKRVLAGVTITSTLLLTSCGLFKEQRSVAQEFFDLLDTDVAAAFELTSAEFQAVTTLEDLELLVEMNPQLQDIAGVSFNSMEMDNNYTELYGSINYGDGTVETLGVYLVKTDEWRVSGFETNI